MKRTMKRMMIVSALAGISAAAMAEPLEIKGVEISGYLDMSYSSTTTDDGTTSSYGLDAANIKFAADLSDDVYVEARLNGTGFQSDIVDGKNSIELEQAYVAYSGLSDVTFIAGKFLSSLGWEAYHAPNLYQYSYALGGVIPGMQNGASASYATESFSVYGAVLASVWDNYDTDASRAGVEGSIKYIGVEDLTVFLGAATESNPGFQQSLVNLWASYQFEKLLLAAEANVVTDYGADGTEGFGWLFMANYMFTEKLALTARTSGFMLEDAAGNDEEDDIKFTIAPLYSLTDNLSFVAEYNVVDLGVQDDTAHTIAFEAIVTF